MNSPTSIKDEPLRLHEVAFASVVVVAACASVAVAFSALAVGHYAGDLMKRIRRKGDHRHET